MREKTSKATKVGTYPQIGVISAITIALFVTGSFALIIIHADQLKKLIRSNIQIRVYLRQNIDAKTRKYVQNQLTALKFVDKKYGKPRIEFISKEESAKNMIQETGHDFVDFLGENPLRDAFLVRLKEEYLRRNKLKIIKTRINAIKGVYEVDYPDADIDQININIHKIEIIASIFMLVLFFSVFILISNTIKLAVYSQRFLIRSMQLVGATPWFIKKPFLIRGAKHGFIGGVLACTFLFLTLSFVNVQIKEFTILQDLSHILMLLFSLIVLGMVVCLLSIYIFVSRYLEMSLDDLYQK